VPSISEKKESHELIRFQLDTRYFRGLEGEYDFTLQFRLEKEGEEDYIVRSSTNYMMSRTVNTDITLDAGKYSVLVKVTAYRRKNADGPEDVVRYNASNRREKLVQIGLSYDLAHTKGLAMDTEAEKREGAEREERHRLAERQKLREQTVQKLKQQHIREKKVQARRKRIAERERLQQAAEKASSHGESQEQNIISNGRHEHDNLTNGLGIQKAIEHGTSSTTNGILSNRPSPRLKTNFTKKSSSDDEIAEMLEDFEFDSDLDMPPESSHSPSLSSSASSPLPPSSSSGGGSGQRGDNHNPWNAVCVVGLKVFSKDPLLKLQVVKPGCCGERGEAPLDRDDPAVSATLEKRTSWL
jgi:hypothetical protein